MEGVIRSQIWSIFFDLVVKIHCIVENRENVKKELTVFFFLFFVVFPSLYIYLLIYRKLSPLLLCLKHGQLNSMQRRSGNTWRWMWSLMKTFVLVGPKKIWQEPTFNLLFPRQLKSRT